MTGTLAPTITEATSALAKYTRDLYNIFPLSICGTIAASIFPETFEDIFFIIEARLLIAASKANGPSISTSVFSF